MSHADFTALLPQLIIAGTAITVLVVLTVRRHHGAVAVTTVAGLLLALATSPRAAAAAPRSVTTLIVVDSYSIFFTGLACAASAAIALVAYDLWRERAGDAEEFYVLLLCATLGACVLASTTHFMAIFLGLETLSVSLYAMIAYCRDDPLGLEGGIKYLILAAVASAFLLFGMALVYAQSGVISLSLLSVAEPREGSTITAAFGVGLAMILVGFGFKLAVVPFHMWTPDIYQGAPPPTAAFVATISKGAVLILLLRMTNVVPQSLWPHLTVILAGVAVLSMFTGNLLALRQPDPRRILAYSSIAHMGYLLVAVIAGGKIGLAAVAFYLIAYFAAMIGAFAVLAVLAPEPTASGLQELLRGLAWRRPLLAGTLVTAFLSLAGIPLTAGFLGKLYVLSAGVDASNWLLVISFVLNSALGLYYYLRVVVSLFRSDHTLSVPDQQSHHSPTPSHRLSAHFATGVVLLVLCGSLIWLGIYPGPLIAFLQSMVSGWPS